MLFLSCCPGDAIGYRVQGLEFRVWLLLGRWPGDALGDIDMGIVRLFSTDFVRIVPQNSVICTDGHLPVTQSLLKVDPLPHLDIRSLDLLRRFGV